MSLKSVLEKIFIEKEDTKSDKILVAHAVFIRLYLVAAGWILHSNHVKLITVISLITTYISLEIVNNRFLKDNSKTEDNGT